jgi:hypothetical protein
MATIETRNLLINADSPIAKPEKPFSGFASAP